MTGGLSASRRFGGIERLYGAGALARLAQAHVCVIGIGGVGSWAVETLARSGVGRLTLIDLDHVAESNLNRQAHALEATLGRAKVQAMGERIAQINPACTVNGIEEFIAPANVATLLQACAPVDLVLDCIDQVRAKAALIGHCRAADLPVITTGGAGGRTDPTRIRVDDLACTAQDALAAKLRATLRRAHGFPREPKRMFGVPCVYSDEPIRRPAGADFCLDGAAGLACAGYGSSMAVTAGFGLAAAARALGILAPPSS
ncbi:MAG: tRNA threonylcarbamoyladenosine dehydratase [Sulfuritalea sp.]|nr:tRNA threonylcarbamoyladenosine dehydratase [Sulfuritalea sp.]